MIISTLIAANVWFSLKKRILSRYPGPEDQVFDVRINILKQGLPTDAFDKLRDRLKVSDNPLSNIVQISKHTLNPRRQDGRLKKPARGLGRKIPLEYSDTDLGAQEVVNLLGRIEHGVFPGCNLFNPAEKASPEQTAPSPKKSSAGI